MTSGLTCGVDLGQRKFLDEKKIFFFEFTKNVTLDYKYPVDELTALAET